MADILSTTADLLEGEYAMVDAIGPRTVVSRLVVRRTKKAVIRTLPHLGTVH